MVVDIVQLPAGSAFDSDPMRHNAAVLLRGCGGPRADEDRRLNLSACYSGSAWFHFADRNPLRIDPATLLILNEGREYRMQIGESRPTEVFRLMFRRGLLSEVLTALTEPLDRLLDDPERRTTQPFEFCEQLHPIFADGPAGAAAGVARVARFIHRSCLAASPDATWLEEQLCFLAERLLLLHRTAMHRVGRLGSPSPVLRREIHQRVSRAADFIHSHYDEALSLDRIAAEAYMSRHHFLRTFKALMGTTPYAFLQLRRVDAARRLLQHTRMTVMQVAERVGYDSATSLYRNLKRHAQCTPGQLRGAA